MYLISWRIYESEEKVFKITTFITILGIINVPIIKYSVDWWNTLHQPASINILAKSSIHSSMLFPLIIMTAAFALFSLLIFLMKYNTELIKIKNKGLDLKVSSKSKISSLLAHLTSLLENKDFFIPKEKRHSMILNINNLIYRLEPNDKELRILASIISTLSKK